MPDPITRTQLENASVDALALADIVNGAADLNGDGLVQTRTGGEVRTLLKLYEDIDNEAASQISTAVETVSADIISGVATATAAEERRRKWDQMLTQLAARNIPRGIIDLDQYGIDDYDWAYNKILFWWTGAVLWPLRKVDSTFDYRWIDGDILYTAANGDFYMSVSIPKMNDPEFDSSLTLVDWHANFSTGTDDLTSDRGLSEGNPFKTYDFSIVQIKAAALPFHLHLYGDRIGLSSMAAGTTNMTISDGLVGKISFHPVNLLRSYVVPMRDALTKANFAWASQGSGTWKCSVAAATIPDAVKKSNACVDALITDEDGVPLPQRYIAPAATEAETIALVKALPGSHSWFGTTGTGLAMIVHCLDGREPDPDNWFHCEGTQNFHWLIGEGSKLYLKGLGRFTYSASAAIAAVRARPITVDVNNRVAHTGQFWMEDFSIVGPSGNAIEIFDLADVGWEYGYIKHAYRDAENIHSFYTTNNAAGKHIRGWSSFVKAESLGMSSFNSPPAASTSINASTIHDQARFTGVNFIGGNCTGACCADVLGAQTLRINAHFFDPLHADDLGPPGSGSPLVAFWADGASAGEAGTTIMRLLGCSGKIPPNGSEFAATNNGSIKYARHIGDITAEFYAGGSVEDTELVLSL